MTNFIGRLCWTPETARDALNSEGEHLIDAVFLATHSTRSLQVFDSSRTLGATYELAPRDFVEQFLSPRRDHVQVVVQGRAGTGKSHFIKWLDLNIPRNETRTVLTIPRAGVSVRSILEMLIDEVPKEREQEYRQRLKEVGYEQLDATQRRQRLISQLALAIGESKPGADKVGDDREMERDLIARIPDLINDPQMRKHLSVEGGIIDTLVSHIFTKSTQYSRSDSPPEFGEADLDVADVELDKFSRPAQDMARYLMGDSTGNPLKALALRIINRNISAAISYASGFNPQHVVELFEDVRRELRRQGRHLVLLIEDFARALGVDKALTEVLITRGTERNGLCEVRWAMAATTGVYEALPDTFKTRTDFVIDMDAMSASLFGENAEGVTEFAARYLNAVRIGVPGLEQWFTTTSGSRSDLPNKCTGCQWKEECHPAFGKASEYGLYPFNAEALREMALRRAKPAGEPVNARQVLKDVLAPILDEHARFIQGGQFPDRGLAQATSAGEFGHLPARLKAQIQQADPEHADRQLVLIELWGRPPAWSVQAGVYAAFAVPVPAFTPPPPGAERPPTESGKDQPEQRVPKHASTIAALERWTSGGELMAPVVQDLRELVYAAITERLDWDALGVKASTFSSTGASDRPFRPSNINFLRQQQSPGVREVRITIPLTEDKVTEASIALQTLLHLAHSEEPSIDIFMDLAMLSDYLDQWTSEVESQLTLRLVGNSGSRDRNAELLVIGAALGGTSPASPGHSETSAMFAEWRAPDISAPASQWNQLRSEFIASQVKVKDAARSTSSGTKGGDVGNYLDAAGLVQTRRRLQSGLTFAGQDADRFNVFRDVDGLHSKLSRIGAAVSEETKRRRAQAEKLRDVLGESLDVPSLVAAAKGLRDTAVAQGLAIDRRLSDRLEFAVTRLQVNNAAVAVTRALELDGAPSLAAIEILANPGMSQLDALVEVAEAATLLKNSIAALVQQQGFLSKATRTPTELLSQIRRALRDVADLLDALR